LTTIGPPEIARYASYVLMAAAPRFVCSLVPERGGAERCKRPVLPGAWVMRITRHPMLAAFDVRDRAPTDERQPGDVVFFGGFAVHLIMDGIRTVARRVRSWATIASSPRPIMPFAAILTGRQQMVTREFPLVPLAVGLALTVVIRQYHDASSVRSPSGPVVPVREQRALGEHVRKRGGNGDRNCRVTRRPPGARVGRRHDRLAEPDVPTGG
jgi:uncharacterized membrane protein